ncbi:MAG: hypothetical protein J6A52_01775 [Bacilli bacterium]|nr:hypothetical protein [Bacilli bacterium]
MNKYDDIIKLPHHVSKRHPQMSIMARSAQFAPFAALSGYDEAVKETARLTDKRLEIDDGLKSILNNKLQYILENININPEIIFTYFVYDRKKTGGKYIEKIGIVKKIDLIEKYILLTDKSKIPIEEIIDINGEIFKDLE